MAYVKVHDNEPLEKALKRFTRKVDEEKILKEFKERQYYVKPSKKRREKIKAAKRKEALKNIKQKHRSKRFDRK